MNSKRATLEVIAPSVEEAIDKGLAEFGLPLDAIEVEILDEGSRGLFGLRGRQARVRLTVKEAYAPEAMIVSPPPPKYETLPEDAAYPESESLPEDESYPESEPPEDESLRIAGDTVKELLTLMKIKARVSARYGETDESESSAPIYVDIHGDDLSILIGKRSETLNALQYITRLIVNKGLAHPATIVIDVEGYRDRRERQIRQLALRMADQALKTGRRQVLEPMPANERRLIHMELRNHPDVITESIGEEPHRKVTIIPKGQ
jgi:spoIIIJ-associated protein